MRKGWNPALPLVFGLIIWTLLASNQGLFFYGGMLIRPTLMTNGLWTTVLIIVLALVGLAIEEKCPYSERGGSNAP